MSQEIEIEFKNMLTKEEYHRLTHYFCDYPKKYMRQKNYYFETEDFQLKQNHAALRIREKKKKYILTLKQPNKNGPGLLETHCPLTEKETTSWINGTIISKSDIEKALSQLNINIFSLKYGGMLLTDRNEFRYKQTNCVLDKSYYNHHTDYEFELEATEESYGLQIFQRLLSKHQIPKRKTLNKIERFYHSLEW